MSYVHDDVDRINILPLLAHGANCVVFDCIGLLDACPIAPTDEDIAKYTCLSIKTVRSALAILLFNDLVTESEGAYRPKQYVRFNGRTREDLPILPREPSDSESSAPTLPSAADGEKVFPAHVCMSGTLPEDEKALESEEKTYIHDGATRKIFAEIGVDGPNLDALSEIVDAELAERWADWHDSKPHGFTRPVGFLVKRLKENPQAEPPFVAKAKEQHRQARLQGPFAELAKRSKP